MQSNATAAAALAAEQTLTPAELDQAHSLLQQTQNGIVGAIKRLSIAQWTFKPAPDRWSIAENAEHVAVVMERVLGPIREQLAAAPPAPAGYDSRRVDSVVIHHFPDRLNRFPAPDAVHPAGRLTPAEAIERLARNYERLAEYLDSTPDLRLHAIEAFPLKAVSKGAYSFMDGYHWILAAAAHTERHTKQILEVMADAAFPEN